MTLLDCRSFALRAERVGGGLDKRAHGGVFCVCVRACVPLGGFLVANCALRRFDLRFKKKQKTG